MALGFRVRSSPPPTPERCLAVLGQQSNNAGPFSLSSVSWIVGGGGGDLFLFRVKLCSCVGQETVSKGDSDIHVHSWAGHFSAGTGVFVLGGGEGG